MLISRKVQRSYFQLFNLIKPILSNFFTQLSSAFSLRNSLRADHPPAPAMFNQGFLPWPLWAFFFFLSLLILLLLRGEGGWLLRSSWWGGPLPLNNHGVLAVQDGAGPAVVALRRSRRYLFLRIMCRMLLSGRGTLVDGDPYSWPYLLFSMTNTPLPSVAGSTPILR